MPAIETRRLEVPGAAILCDASLAAEISAQWFEHDHWRARGALSDTVGGRGGAAFVETPRGPMVLRRYLRGGMAARISREHYLFSGEGRTRCFSEFAVLAALRVAGLAVPQPRAACYWRRGLLYRAAILVDRIEHARPLPALFPALSAANFAAVGAAIAAMHRQGVWHADLNAHNILLDDRSRVWLIDFDRAGFKARTHAAAWTQGNLARLRRSLLKLGAPQMVADFETAWRALLEAHAAQFDADGGFEP